jgi:hypothetical protein
VGRVIVTVAGVPTAETLPAASLAQGKKVWLPAAAAVTVAGAVAVGKVVRDIYAQPLILDEIIGSNALHQEVFRFIAMEINYSMYLRGFDLFLITWVQYDLIIRILGFDLN